MTYQVKAAHIGEDAVRGPADIIDLLLLACRRQIYQFPPCVTMCVYVIPIQSGRERERVIT